MMYIDLRSDTVSHPTPAMREAMYTAEVGDDVYRDDHNHDTYTSYRVDQDEIAQSALDLLLKPDRKPRKVIIYGEPVFRDSVRRIET